MNRDAFDRTQNLLRAAALAIDEAWCDERAFGSWLVSIRTVPRLRIVWDGKDGWLLVQRETSRAPAGSIEWEGVWLERSPNPKSLDEAVGQVLHCERK